MNEALYANECDSKEGQRGKKTQMADALISFSSTGFLTALLVHHRAKRYINYRIIKLSRSL